MKVDNILIDHLANLSRLSFDSQSKKKMKSDLVKMLNFVRKLETVDTEKIEPLVYLSDERNVLRSDIVKNQIKQEEALSNAPEKDSDYFRIPKVIK
jgi:aspartyl-tRNA(Asn)/glutamyl-tRNA(Gln) amidotransferase subunit C